MRRVLILAAGLLLLGCSAKEPRVAAESADTPLAGSTEKQQTAPAARPLLPPQAPTEADYPHLHNLLQASDRIYAGGEPKDDAAFAELARLGIKTVVSVDGARPNLDSAERHGLRYVHIPIGYDGISEDAGQSLARLVKEAKAPFYIHCHHGVHRGPAAAAVACIADGVADGKSALAILEKAETSKGYAGLWRDVEAYVPPAAGEALPELVAVAEVGSLAAAMAIIDRASDNLKLSQAADWQAPPNHPDILPSQEALLLKEGFRETVRKLEESNDYDEQFLTWMRDAEQSAEKLEAMLDRGDNQTALETFNAILSDCKRCHNAYRDSGAVER